MGGKPPGPASSCLVWQTKITKAAFCVYYASPLTPCAPSLDPSCSEAWDLRSLPVSCTIAGLQNQPRCPVF